MAAQHVQAYLEKHRIGALFEDLMANVISDMPEEPIPYLIRTLKKLHTQSNGGSKDFGSLPPSRAKSPFAKSMGLSGMPISRQPSDEGRDHRSALAKSWAGPDAYLEGSKYRPTSGSKVHGREYPRPWLSGSKSTSIGTAGKDNIRPTTKTLHSHNGQERPPWNAKTVVPSHDFDELFALQRRPQRSGNEPLRHYQGASSWGRNGEMDIPNERMVSYYRRTPPHVPSSYEGDSGLDEELYVGKDIKAGYEENDQSSTVSYESIRQGKLKARHAAEEHRQQLQALLMSNDQRRAGRNNSNDIEDLHDDGAELLENVDELESEGVANINKRGTRISKLQSMRRGTETSESVRVSICARCAKIITGQPSERKSDVGSVYSGSEVDDNFESVSQVGSTARLGRPVWPSGFDSENDSSPRNGQHMWQSPSRSPVKGRHMFRGGSFTGEPPDSSRPPTASSSRSDLVLPGKQQRSWNTGGYSSDNDTEANFDPVESTEIASRRPWNRATLESGSETDWYTRPGTRPERRAPRRGFAAQLDSDEESD